MGWIRRDVKAERVSGGRGIKRNKKKPTSGERRAVSVAETWESIMTDYCNSACQRHRPAAYHRSIHTGTLTNSHTNTQEYKTHADRRTHVSTQAVNPI